MSTEPVWNQQGEAEEPMESIPRDLLNVQPFQPHQQYPYRLLERRHSEPSKPTWGPRGPQPRAKPSTGAASGPKAGLKMYLKYKDFLKEREDLYEAAKRSTSEDDKLQIKKRISSLNDKHERQKKTAAYHVLMELRTMMQTKLKEDSNMMHDALFMEFAAHIGEYFDHFYGIDILDVQDPRQPITAYVLPDHTNL